MKILKTDQIRQLDQETIRLEPIASIDLMERASLRFTESFMKLFGEIENPIILFCGIGNNGGDGLAIARLLSQRFYRVVVYCCEIAAKRSLDAQQNFDRLPKRNNISVLNIQAGDPLPSLDPKGILIDALFGSGLNRPIEGYWADLVRTLNKHPGPIVAVDVPSGLMADQHSSGVSIHADYTISFELPKLAFLFPENAQRVGHWKSISIGLDQSTLATMSSYNTYITIAIIKQILKLRNKFGHKGNFGHALLMMGSYGKVGAAILAARACLRSGAGLVSIHAPQCAYPILQSTVPEAMVSIDPHHYYCSEAPDLGRYKTIAIGCGMDTKSHCQSALEQVLAKAEVPLVLDADALNLLAAHPELQNQIPKNSILTPHPKEFERLFGPSANDFERNQLQRTKAQELEVYLILKGAHTCIASPDGHCYFNSSGNPGMATGGSGDVLTGILAGLLAQGYSSLDAALLGVYIHGLSGDLAIEHWVSEEALLASDLIDHLGRAYGKIRSTTV
ncbi:MAG: NAD(P)H-hydrate dehydratase [Bacteroidota bacterium]